MRKKFWNEYHNHKNEYNPSPNQQECGIMLYGDAHTENMNKAQRIGINVVRREDHSKGTVYKELFLGKYTIPLKPSKSTGYYAVNVRCEDTKSGRRQIKAKTLEELKQKLIDYDAGIDLLAKPKTFAECFALAMEEQLKYVKDPDKKLSAQATVEKYESDYRRFFYGSKIDGMYIADVRASDIEKTVYDALNKYSLTKKRFAALRLILSKTFSYAMQHHLIGENVYEVRCNFSKFKDMTVAPAKTKDRAHTRKELAAMRAFIAEKHKKDPSYLPAYALELQMLVGLRRGEVPPLLWSDIASDELGEFLSIERIQLTVKKSKYNPTEYEKIVNHTKTGEDREIPLFPELRDLILRIRDVHDRYGIKSEFLFPADTETGCISNYTVYEFYRRMCKKLGIKLCRDKMKGPHSYRRNVGSRIVNSSGGNIELATQILGNSPDVFREHYYTGAEREQMASALSIAE